MTSVRISRPEQRRQLTARKKQGAPTDAQLFVKGRRNATDPRTLLEALRLNKFQLKGLVADLHQVIESDCIDSADFASHIFAPELRDLRALPPALLDARDRLLPNPLVPTTQVGLRRLLERLMVLNGDKNDYDLLVTGWRSPHSSSRAFDQHVRALFAVRAADPALYQNLVTGCFAPVIRQLQDLPQSPIRVRIREILIRQALIWCCHDVQMLVARIAKPIALGALGTNSRAKQSPERELNHQRDRYAAVAKSLDLFFKGEDWRDKGAKLIGPSEVRVLGKPENRWIGQISRHLRRGGKAPEDISLKDVTALMRVVAALMRDPDDSIAPMTLAKTTNVEPRTFAAKRFHVSSPITAIVIAVWRLVQAEQQMPAVVDQLISGPSPTSREAPDSLPAFPSFAPAHGSLKRVEEVTNFFTEAFLGELNREGSIVNWKHLREAERYLSVTSIRTSLDARRKLNGRLDAFTLLDVLPELRFAALRSDWVGNRNARSLREG